MPQDKVEISKSLRFVVAQTLISFIRRSWHLFWESRWLHPSGKYIGLPQLVGGNKREAFQSVWDRVWNKLAEWNGRLSSHAGREMLIKAVALALSNYTMTVFQLPSTLCQDLESMLAQFWWGGDSEKKKLHWKAWSKLFYLGCRVGLVSRTLASPIRLFLQNRVGFVVTRNQNFKSKVFFFTYAFLNATTKPSDSFVWKSIIWKINYWSWVSMKSW